MMQQLVGHYLAVEEAGALWATKPCGCGATAWTQEQSRAASDDKNDNGYNVGHDGRGECSSDGVEECSQSVSQSVMGDG